MTAMSLYLTGFSGRVAANLLLLRHMYQIRNIMGRFTYAILILFLLYGCKPQPEQPKELSATERNHKRELNPWNTHMADSLIRTLHTGDLVMRTGNDVTSYMLCQFNQKNKTYSHCGLVMIENGYPFVYHSIGGEDNPDERMRRDSASFFVAPVNNLGFGIARFDLNPVQFDSLHAIVQRFYQRRPLFDMNFDLETDDKLYCAEFIYKAMAQASGDSVYFRPTSVAGYTFMGIDDLFTSPHAKTICEIRYK